MAAGGSSRLNSPKQLLDWQGDYLINHIIRTVAASNIEDIILLLGNNIDKIKLIILDEKVKIVENHKWQSGMSSSIQTGITSLSEDVDGAFIILVDQPFITVTLFNKMIDVFESSNADIIAPRVGDQQANPVLFPRSLFPKILNISGDKGAKSLLKDHKVKWVDWHDANLLLDIDSEDDYQKAIDQLSA